MNRWNKVYIYIHIYIRSSTETELEYEKRDFLCKSVGSFDTFRFNIESLDQASLALRFIENKKKSTLETRPRVFSPSFRGFGDNSRESWNPIPLRDPSLANIFLFRYNIVSRIMIFWWNNLRNILNVTRTYYLILQVFEFIFLLKKERRIM